MKPIVFWWDWREQPSWEGIAKAVRTNPGWDIYEVDTRCDEYAIVIGPLGMSEDQVQKAWDDRFEEN